jgi:hypothetical protein
MIVRIATEGQYELDGDPAELGELDEATVTACESGDEARFHETYARLLEYVRSHGRPVGDDQLTGSDVILPPPDVSFEEAKEGFSGEGLIPG